MEDYLDEIIQANELDVSLVGFDVNEWGSCQYSGALDIFNVLTELRKKHSYDETLKRMGIEVKFDSIASLKDASNIIIEIADIEEEIEELKESIKRFKAFIEEGEYPFDEPVDWFDRYIKEDKAIKYSELNEVKHGNDRIEYLNDCLNGFKSLEELFIFTRNYSWDLWSAAQQIGVNIFERLEINGVPKAPGIGPVLNIEVQGENFITGLFCWLLVEHGLVKDVSVFSGFDT